MSVVAFTAGEVVDDLLGAFVGAFPAAGCGVVGLVVVVVVGEVFGFGTGGRADWVLGERVVAGVEVVREDTHAWGAEIAVGVKMGSCMFGCGRGLGGRGLLRWSMNPICTFD